MQLNFLENFVLSQLAIAFEDEDDSLKDLRQRIRNFLVFVKLEYKKNSYHLDKLIEKAKEGGYFSKNFTLPEKLLEKARCKENRYEIYLIINMILITSMA